METNKQWHYPSGSTSGAGVDTLAEPVPAASSVQKMKDVVEPSRMHGSVSRSPSWLGPGLAIKGELSGTEDLQLECKVDGPVSLGGHRLTVGQNAHVSGEIVASEIIIHGEVSGNLLASDRVEIKKHGSVMGDLTTARIMIEDGAYFKGTIEIAPKNQPALDLDTLLARPEKKRL